MKLITCHAGTLHVRQTPAADPSCSGGEPPGDCWEAGRTLAGPAIHELVFDHGSGHPPPVFPAVVLARGAMRVAAGGPGGRPGGAVVWIDSTGTLYPPGVIAAGIPADRLYVLRAGPADLVRAAVDCLRCEGVAAVVAALPPRVSRVEVRRLQLAAERGRGVGVLLRAAARGVAPDVYAAASRWLVAPAPGERGVQRWSVRLIHGHGGHIGQTFLLEKRRDSSDAHAVHPPAPLAHHPPLPRRAAGA